MRNVHAIGCLLFLASAFIAPAQAQGTSACKVGEWEAWSQCSAPCGGGTQRRARKVSGPPGLACPPAMEMTKCNSQACAPVACTMSPWGSWSQCSVECGGGTQSRTRTIVGGPPIASGAARCPPLVETMACNTQRCAAPACQVSAWSEWSACSAPCNGGVRKRARTVLTSAPGAKCPLLTEVSACNVQACTPK